MLETHVRVLTDGSSDTLIVTAGRQSTSRYIALSFERREKYSRHPFSLLRCENVRVFLKEIALVGKYMMSCT